MPPEITGTVVTRGSTVIAYTLKRLCVVLVLLLPWFLLHVRAAADIGIAIVAACFLVRCVVDRQWSWAAEAWVVAAGLWWTWLIVCTVWNIRLPGQGPEMLVQAIGIGRLLVFTAALECWVLQDTITRRQFQKDLMVAATYVAAQTLLQFVTGHNVYGAPRWGDGSLTGPFSRPRAGPTFVRMLFPVLLPPAAALLEKRGVVARLSGLTLVLGAVATMVLIGQRMPVLLTAFGLTIAALLLKQLRGPAVVAIAVGGLLVAASVVVSPPTFYRLVTRLSQQMENFADSHYGWIAKRAVIIAEQHPWTGRGYDGFATGCAEPRYFQDWHWPGQPASGDGGGASLCVNHPHNFYLQAVTDAGVPGLLLFCVMMGLWLGRLGSGLVRRPEPLRVGLFIAALLQAWPIASTSPLQSMPIGGWFFLLLGFGLAEAHAAPVPGRAAEEPADRHENAVRA